MWFFVFTTLHKFKIYVRFLFYPESDIKSVYEVVSMGTFWIMF